MLCAIGFNVAACRDIILQAWLCKQSDVGREFVLQAEARADRPLPRGADGGPVGSLQFAMQVVACVER